MAFLPSNQLVTTAFCALGTPGDDFVLPPITGSEASTVQTQQYGIPPIQAQPEEVGGLAVLRTETNGVLQFYSNVIKFINEGGQFTFDATQSAAIGGYSQGSILFCASNKSFQLSLINNNTFNFVTNPAYINDGVHWQQITTSNLNPYPDITDNTTTHTVSITGSGGLKVLSGPFVASWVGTNGVTTSISNLASADEWNIVSTEVSTNNVGRMYTYVDPVTHIAQAGFVTYIAGVEAYRLAVVSNERPTIAHNGGPLPAITNDNHIVVGSDLLPGSSLTPTGHRKNPDGSITQWGTIVVPGTGSGGTVSASFDIPFPNTCLSISCSAYIINPLSTYDPYVSGNYSVCKASGGTSGRTTVIAACSGGASGSVSIEYIAEGY